MNRPPIVGVLLLEACSSLSRADALSIRSRKRPFSHRIAMGPQTTAVTNEITAAKAIRAVRKTRESPVDAPESCSKNEPYCFSNHTSIRRSGSHQFIVTGSWIATFGREGG